jgi:peptidyl-prolyl cis-trans isomerase SurA
MSIRPCLVLVGVLTLSLAHARGPFEEEDAKRSAVRPLDRVLAVVNQEVITERELTWRRRSIEARLRDQNITLPPGLDVQREVLERMITELAVMQRARQVGIRVEDGLVDRALARLATERQLDLAQLRQQLRDQGSSLESLRQEIAQELIMARLREREVELRVRVSESEVDAELAHSAQASGRRAAYAISQWVVHVPHGAGADQVARARRLATELATRARQDRLFDQLVTAQQVRSTGFDVRYTDLGMRSVEHLPALLVTAVEKLSPGEIAPVVQSLAGFHVLKLVEREIIEATAAGQADDPVIQQTRVAHILVRVDELNPEAEVVRRLTEIRERIVAGVVSFADMARQYSVDASAGQGGSLGWIDQGETVPEFERAMDALAPGVLSEPVRSPFGYHLIQVQERRTDSGSPEARRALARKRVRERKVLAAYQEFLDQIRGRAYVELRLDDE